MNSPPRSGGDETRDQAWAATGAVPLLEVRALAATGNEWEIRTYLTISL
jgi:hypothetical protein